MGVFIGKGALYCETYIASMWCKEARDREGGREKQRKRGRGRETDLNYFDLYFKKITNSVYN